MKEGARLAVFVWLTVCGSGSWLHAQTPASQAPASQSPIDPNSPLAPVQEREQLIQQYDPLAPADKELDQTDKQKDQRKNQNGNQDSGPGPNPSGRQSGPTVVEDDTSETPAQEYSGPPVLSRDYTLNQLEIPKNIKWSESVNIGTSYDTGVGANGLNGTATGGNLSGINVGWSVSGNHAFGRDQLGFSYSSGLVYFPQSSYYSGGNHAVSLRYSHRISRRISLGISASGSLQAANAALQTPATGQQGTIANVNLAISPNTSILSGGSKQGTLGANVGWQLTSRISAGFSVSAFGVKQDSSALTGVSGESASGNLSYRYSRRTTIGVSYSYSQYVYPHGTSTSDSQSIGIIYSYSIDSRTQFGLNAGMGQTETLSLQTVPLNPVIAALLGVGSCVIDAYQSSRSLNTSAQLTRSLGRGRQLSIGYARGVSPGNGLLQTSQQQSITLSLSGTLFRFGGFAVSGGGGWDDLSALGPTAATYGSESAHVSASRSYRRGMGVSFSMQYRHFDIATVGAPHDQLTFSTSFSWSRTSRGMWLY